MIVVKRKTTKEGEGITLRHKHKKTFFLERQEERIASQSCLRKGNAAYRGKSRTLNFRATFSLICCLLPLLYPLVMIFCCLLVTSMYTFAFIFCKHFRIYIILTVAYHVGFKKASPFELTSKK